MIPKIDVTPFYGGSCNDRDKVDQLLISASTSNKTCSNKGYSRRSIIYRSKKKIT